jgi:hypothetical protein
MVVIFVHNCFVRFWLCRLPSVWNFMYTWSFQIKLLTASFRVTENLNLSTWRWRQWGFLEILVCLYKTVFIVLHLRSQYSHPADMYHCLYPGKQNLWSFAVIPKRCLSTVRYEQYVPIPLWKWHPCKSCSCRSLKMPTVSTKLRGSVTVCAYLCSFIYTLKKGVPWLMSLCF